MTIRSLALLFGLIIAGFFGNYFSVPLFFGADFLFGSLAVLLVLYYYGLAWGLLAALVASSYTWFLWGHPYAIINFFSEALFVGLFLRRGHRNLLALVAIFWLLLGVPLVGLEYGLFLGMDTTSTLFIMLKQSLNGIFNAMLANLAVCFLPLDKLFQRRPALAGISLQESLFNLLVLMVLLPVLLLSILESRYAKESLEANIIAGLQSVSETLQSNLHLWFQRRLQAVQELARLAGDTNMTPKPLLQGGVELLQHTFPDFKAMHVTNTAGRTIAFSPTINEQGVSTLGRDFSDRPWFQGCLADQRPFVSQVFPGRVSTQAPLIVIAVPVLWHDQCLGVAAGALDLLELQQMLQPYAQEREDIITLTDSQHRVIASTAPDRASMQPWDRRHTGISQTLDRRMYQWYPGDAKLPAMTRWQRSFYVQEVSLGPELPWTLTLEVPVAPLQRALYAIYVRNLTIMAVLIALVLPLSLVLSRWFTLPLAQLARLTADLPDKLSEAQNLTWPVSSALEINALIDNTKAMAATLDKNFHKLYQEVQERRRAEAELLDSEEKYRRLIETTNTGYVIVNAAGRVLDANLEFVRLTGYGTHEEILGQTVVDLAAASDKEKTLAALRQCLKTGSVRHLEVYCQGNNDQPIPVEANATAIHTADGVKFLALVQDISDRKRVEAEKAKLEVQLVQSQKLEAIGTLAGGIAHDFNNILGAMTGFTELTIDALPQGSREYDHLTQVLLAGKRAKDLINQILLFSRKAAQEKKPLQLSAILKETIKLLRASLPTTIDIRDHLAASTALVLADPTQINQILINLGTNAAFAMRDTGGLLDVNLQEVTLEPGDLINFPDLSPGPYVKLTVRDNGPGMDREVVRRIFEPFFTTKQVGEGTGLGLAVVHGIVKASGGDISVYSRPGQGTVFTILLPRVGSEAAAAADDLSPYPTGHDSILFVDDEAMLVKLTREMLQKLGYQVEVQTSSLAALKLFQSHPGQFDLVITDQTMPEMTGIQLARELRHVRPDIPIILCTGYSEKVSPESIASEGINDLLPKPIFMRTLAESVRRVLA